jgi:hypothetical protein
MAYSIILLESVFVGFYSLLMSILILNLFNFSMTINTFIIGFLKHFISGLFGLQQYYCSRYIKCDEFALKNLLFESIGEGLLYVIAHFVISRFIVVNEYLSFFIIGMLLHISFEGLGIHSSFCKSHCKEKIL